MNTASTHDPMAKIADDLMHCLLQLIDANRRLRRAYPAMALEVPLHNYAMLFATVRMSIGRRSGQSTLIAHLAEPGDIIIAPSGDVAKYFKATFKPRCEVVGQREYARMLRWTPESDTATVWIDEIQAVPDLGNVYKACARDTTTTFVALGSVY